MRNELAVVIITKNLEWNISRVIDSVFRDLPDAVVLVVDSASTDRTVDLALASRHPLSIIRLAGNQRLTAAAGRWVGERNTDSEFIMFLDGDVELVPGFAATALEILRDHPSVGAVDGFYIDVPKSGAPRSARDQIRRGTSFRDVPFVSGGASVYRRAALDAAGSFAVDIFSDEEPSLGIRMRHAGYRVVRLDRTSAFHHSDPVDKVGTVLRRRGRNLWIGSGQNIRYFAGTGLLGVYLRERGDGIAPAGFLVIAVAAITTAMVTGNPACALAPLGLLLAVWLFLAIKRRSAYAAFFSIVRRFIILEGTIRGLMDKPKRPEEYHIEYEVIR